MEINVFSPGGLGSCERLYGVNFAEAVIQDVERKLELRAPYGAGLSNRRLATL
jgi:glutathione synthase